MLVITRSLHETVRIGDDIEITVCRLAGGKVRLGIRAPRSVPIWRQEVLDRLLAEGLPTTSPADGGAMPPPRHAPVRDDRDDDRDDDDDARDHQED